MLHANRNKSEDDEDTSFQSVDCATVVQETRAFNTSGVRPKHAAAVLTSLLYVLGQGDKLAEEETTTVFFNVTKLYQSSDPLLRRLLYLVIKELSTATEDAIMVVSSVTKDITSPADVYRGNAIRVLCRICEPQMLAQVERYLKSSIVDRNPVTASAALVAGYQLLADAPDLVRRWIGEVQEAIGSRNPMVQYHAVGLLHGMKRNDKMAVFKLVAQLAKEGVRSPWAHTLLVRFAANALKEGVAPESAKALQSYLVNCLDKPHADMVMLEAARAVCTLPGFTPQNVGGAISVLQLLLSSHKPTLRFAAVRTLSQVANAHPLAVSTCNVDLETLAADSNRSIATVAITTLLKTGRESSVDRLVKQISTFLYDVSDEFKIVVVLGVKQLALKFPDKHRVLLNMLGSSLREDGGFAFKREVVLAILGLMKDIPGCTDAALQHLCDFIEDCEYVPLLTHILNVLGSEGPRTHTPAKWLRYVYNRIILESATVRAAAVTALVKFATAVDSLRKPVMAVLERCMKDADDEVRDRACLYYTALSSEGSASILLNPEVDVPLQSLERSLRSYLADKTAQQQPFDITTVPTDVPDVIAPSAAPSDADRLESMSARAPVASSATAAPTADFTEVAGVPAELGTIIVTGEPESLTEKELEIGVTVTKVIGKNHVALVFSVSNTLEDQSLSQVRVILTAEDNPGMVIKTPAIALVGPGAALPTSALLLREDVVITATFNCRLLFVLTDDGGQDGIDEEYTLETVELGVADFISKAHPADFNATWAELADSELKQEFGLSAMPNIEQASKEVIKLLGLYPLTDVSIPKGATEYTIRMAGAFCNTDTVLAVANFVQMAGRGVGLQLAVRGTNAEITELVAGSIG
eukprot:TRINITY_DN5535_c0_g1_i1.p1 TRINITY_DN5535_c0_g1~~TRINITY_DN5535_c0_g1_i1.p1  ORF type:complete len:870 (+),score=251.30 TRINITY_DN5535_c0_g1_i1:62-2671(+)